MKRIIVTDLDGTLLDEHERIHSIDIDILQEIPDDVIFIPASGRALSSIKHVFISNHCNLPEPFPFPVISLNGAMGFLPGEKTAFYHPLPNDLINEVLQQTDKYRQICFLFLDKQKAVMVNPTQFGMLGEIRYHFGSVPYQPGIPLKDIAKIMCLSDDREALQEYEHSVNHLDCSTAFSMDTIFEITPTGVNKGSGLMDLLSRLGLDDRFSIFGAGDGGNDLEMLECANVRFASDQSPEYIRNRADRIYPYGSDLLNLMLNTPI